MSNETINNYGKSIRSKLLNISRKENVFHQTILTRFFQERLLYRMSKTRYRSNFYVPFNAMRMELFLILGIFHHGLSLSLRIIREYV